MNGPDHGSSEHLFLSSHEFFEEIDGDVVIWWKVYTTVRGEKIINFALAPVLSSKFFTGDLLLQLRFSFWNLLHLLVALSHLLKFFYFIYRNYDMT